MPAPRLVGRGRRPRMFPRQDPSGASSSAPTGPQPSSDAVTPSDPASAPTSGADPTTTPTSDGEPTTSPQTTVSTPSSSPSPTSNPPTTTAPPTSDPPTSDPPTSNPPTSDPPTTVPPTTTPTAPPTSDTPTTTPPTTTPPTTTPPTTTPPTSSPPTTTPPTSTPPTSDPPPSTPPTSEQPPTTSEQPPTTTEQPPTTTQQPTTTEPPPPTSTIVSTDVPSTTTIPPPTTVTSTSSTGTGTPTLVKTTMTSNGKTVVMTSTVAGGGGGLQSGQSSSGGSTDTNIGAIVGGVLGALAVIGALVAVFLFWRHRRKKQRYDHATQMATRPSWTPLSPVVTGPSRPSVSEPYHDPYYEPFTMNHDASGPCSTQPQPPEKIRSNPNSQYSQYSQLSTMDPSPESSTRALINPPTAGAGATIVGGGAALAARPLSDATMEEHWKEAKMYQDYISSSSGPVDRAGHTGTPTSSYAWGAASPKKRTLGMTNPDPESPDTPRSSYFGSAWTEGGGDGGSGAAAAGKDAAEAAAARSAGFAAASVPKIASPPRPARDARRLSSPLLVPTTSNDSSTSVRSNPYKVVESDAAYNPYKADAGDAYSALAPAVVGPSSSSQPGIAITTAPGAESSGAGRLAVSKGANLARQETLPKYEAEDERRFSGIFGDLKRDLIDRREE